MLRNRDFILGILRDVLPTKGVILEIASGSGEHIVHFARHLPNLVFQPSDREPDALQSVAAWVKATRVTNVRAPMVLDASQSPWPIASADGIICINMVHISPARCRGSGAHDPLVCCPHLHYQRVPAPRTAGTLQHCGRSQPRPWTPQLGGFRPPHGYPGMAGLDVNRSLKIVTVCPSQLGDSCHCSGHRTTPLASLRLTSLRRYPAAPSSCRSRVELVRRAGSR